MKKTYIIPQSIIVRLMSREQVMQGSAKIKGDIEVDFGGDSEDDMTSDVKVITDVNIWTDEW